MINFTIQQITSFFAVVEHGTLSSAAQALYVSPPSLSKTLRKLEENLDVKLFDRKYDGVVLTKQGEYLYNSFKSCLSQLAASLDTAKDMTRSSEKILRVGLFITSRLLSDFEPIRSTLKSYKALYPDVQVYEDYMMFSDMRRNLMANNLDIIFSLDSATSNMLNVKKKRICKASWYIAVSKNSPLAQGDRLDISKLNSENFFFLPQEETQIDKAMNIERCMQIGFTPKNALIVQNAISLTEVVRNGQGLYIGIGGRLSDDDIKCFTLPVLANTPYITAVWRAQSQNAELTNLIELL